MVGGGGRKSRNLPLNSRGQLALQAYLHIRPSVLTDVLFINKAGEPFGDRGVQKMIERYMDEAGIKGASVESLRHTFGTHHAARGTDLRTIQKVMGIRIVAQLRPTFILPSMLFHRRWRKTHYSSQAGCRYHSSKGDFTAEAPRWRT